MSVWAGQATADLAYTQACSMEPSNFSVYHLLTGGPSGSGDLQMMIQQQRWESGTVVSSRTKEPRS